jgi:hypothetical protein
MEQEFFLSLPEGKGIYGVLDDAGVITFAIQAGEDSSIRGTEMFNRMVAFFGDEVKATRGVWVKSRDGGVSTNIDKVNELTGAGMSIEEAVGHAWTVTRARKLGFGKAKIVGPPHGSRGAYTMIEVLVER